MIQFNEQKNISMKKVLICSFLLLAFVITRSQNAVYYVKNGDRNIHKWNSKLVSLSEKLIQIKRDMKENEFTFVAKSNNIHNWQCYACKTIIQKDSKPETGRCKQRDKRESCSGCGHGWKDLGLYGNDTYQCYFCDAIIQSNGKPNNVWCEQADLKISCKGCTHSWKKF